MVSEELVNTREQKDRIRQFRGQFAKLRVESENLRMKLSKLYPQFLQGAWRGNPGIRRVCEPPQAAPVTARFLRLRFCIRPHEHTYNQGNSIYCTQQSRSIMVFRQTP